MRADSILVCNDPLVCVNYSISIALHHGHPLGQVLPFHWRTRPQDRNAASRRPSNVARLNMEAPSLCRDDSCGGVILRVATAIFQSAAVVDPHGGVARVWGARVTMTAVAVTHAGEVTEACATA